MQLLFESLAASTAARRASACSRARSPYLDTQGERLPHIGWNLVRTKPAKITAGLGDVAFYHVHSLVVRPADEADRRRDGDARRGRSRRSSSRGNVFGAQFHPEKSSRDGLALLQNFVTA